MMSPRHLLTIAFALAVFTAAVQPRHALAQTSQQAKAEARLREVQQEMDRIRQEMGRDASQRDQLTRELRDAEVAAGAARNEVLRLQRERAQRAAKRQALAQQRDNELNALAKEREALGGQMRAAFMIGREEPLKLLLNQRDPARAGRMFVYYSYFGRARAEQIHRIEDHVTKLEALELALAEQESQLAQIEHARRGELVQLDKARGSRGVVLASLTEEARSREASLRRLQRQQGSLEKLLRELRRAIQRFPVDSTSQFGKLRGKLPWPTTGRLLARYGETRAGGLKWDGMLIRTERAAPVRAVYHGRVIFADWLAGLGLLVIVDHGDGYLSLYGHNDAILKRVGDQVTAGDAIAEAGDSGGRNSPELYFEIRKAGKPIDPRPWFASSAPAG